MTQRRNRVRDRIVVVMALYLVVSGCSGGGCSCLAPLPNGFPSNEREPNALQARVTQTGVQVIENNAASIVGELAGGMGLTFGIPETCSGNPLICCGTPDCGIAIDLDPRPGDPPRMELTPMASPDNRLGLLLRARIHTTRPMPISYDTGLFTLD